MGIGRQPIGLVSRMNLGLAEGVKLPHDPSMLLQTAACESLNRRQAKLLIEVEGKFVTVSNKRLDGISVCQPRELSVARGDRLHLKASRKLPSGDRTANGRATRRDQLKGSGSVEGVSPLPL